MAAQAPAISYWDFESPPIKAIFLVCAVNGSTDSLFSSNTTERSAIRCGLVQIPCIERNAYAAARALDANLYSSFTDGMHRVSFDKVVEVMKETESASMPTASREA